MGIIEKIRKKTNEINQMSEQMKAELLRQKMNRSSKKGSFSYAYNTGMNPLDYGKMKMKEYREKRSDKK